MKDIMEAHVGTQRMSIFQAATRVVQDQLGVMCRELKKRLQDEADDLHDILRRDYLSALVGSEVANRKGLPRVERALRAEIVPYLQETDPLFAPVVKGEPEEPEKVEEPEEPKQERAASEGLFVPPDAAANEAADDHDTTMVDASIVDTSVVDASMVDAPPPSSAPIATSTIKAEPFEPAPLLSSNQASVPAIKNEHAAPVQPAVEPSRAPSVASPEAVAPTEAAARPEPLQTGTAASEVVQAVGVAHERARAATAGPDAVGTAIAVPQPLRAATTDPDPISNIKREPQGDHNLLASFCSERNPNSDDEEEFSTATEGEDDEDDEDEDDDNAESSSDEDSSRAPSVEMDLVKPEPTDH